MNIRVGVSNSNNHTTLFILLSACVPWVRPPVYAP
jgi:hypothetical protein